MNFSSSSRRWTLWRIFLVWFWLEIKTRAVWNHITWPTVVNQPSSTRQALNACMVQSWVSDTKLGLILFPPVKLDVEKPFLSHTKMCLIKQSLIMVKLSAYSFLKADSIQTFWRFSCCQSATDFKIRLIFSKI